MLRVFRRSLAVSTFPLLLTAVWGCDGPGGPPSTDSTTAESTVSGTVTVMGKLATQGNVTFDPANIRRKDAKSVTAPIGKDGTYKVTTLAGENRVIVDTPDVRKNADALGNGETTHSANAGTDTFNIELSAPAVAPK